MALPRTRLTDTLTRYQGEVRPLTVSFELNGSPLNVSNYRFTVTLARSPSSTPLYKAITQIADGSSGLVSLSVPRIATVHPPGTYYLEVRYLTPGGIDQVAAGLPFNLKPALSLT